MIRDITLGQYFPGDSVIHRLDPRTKIIWTFFYIILLFFMKTAVGFAAFIVLTAVIIALTKIKVKYILRGIKPVLDGYKRRCDFCGSYGFKACAACCGNIASDVHNIADKPDRRYRKTYVPVFKNRRSGACHCNDDDNSDSLYTYHIGGDGQDYEGAEGKGRRL